MATQAVFAEVTGSVWKIVAKPGDLLEMDDPVMVLESMKMEIPVLAPERGRLVKLLVSEKDAVKDGQEVAIIESE